MSPTSEKLSGLRRSFALGLTDRYKEIEAFFAAFVEHGDHGRLADFRRCAHNLAGSCGSYGYAEIGRIARELEQLAESWSAGQPVDNRSVSRRLALMRRQIFEAGRMTTARAAPDLPIGYRSNAGCAVVHLLEDDQEMAELLVEQLRPYGYRAIHHADPSSMLQSFQTDPPAALIFDVELTGGARGPAAALDLPADLRARVPIIFLSGHGDLDSRIEAIRAGAAAYLTKPPNMAEIVDLLDRLTRTREVDPYRALVVDDSLQTASLYAACLEAAGMVTRVAGGAEDAMAAIEDFGPEIILLDLYMPDIGGDELAQVIRQHSSLLSVPIVFVSAESDRPTQIAALHHGADEFITKPVDLDNLPASVKVRAERYRDLRASMQRDSLTGLLDHRHAKEALETELSRARRTGSPLSVALLDIDHFKSVNDDHGHPVGDRVIKSLARILSQRLRRSDVIGRYGGEEFLVVLPDTPVAEASLVLDNLRESFRDVTHRGIEGRFSRSFSCGITEARPDDDDLDGLITRADRGLYHAKQGGRDRLVAC